MLMDNYLGNMITKKRKELGYTQQNLADMLHISFQSVSKWENGTSAPAIHMLPQLAYMLQTSVDALLGYEAGIATKYEEKYEGDMYYWGIEPNTLCYEIMKLKPPKKPYKVLDIGCGEGKDAVFLARNGYRVTAFDLAENGLKKAKKLAEYSGVEVNFFKADIKDYVLKDDYDIIFCSGVLHYLEKEYRKEFIDHLKQHTALNGLNVMNVFVQKYFIDIAPDLEDSERNIKEPWSTGELDGYYHDWYFYNREEVIFDCNSGGVPHKHCMDIVIVEKVAN